MRIVIAAILAAGMSSQAQASSEPFLGEIETYAFEFCPTGFAPLDGRLLSIADNDALFALIGTSYGGDGQTTFALPAAKPVPSASGFPLTQCIALQGIFPSQN